MSTRNLDKMMAPRSVVAIGASVRPGSVGAAVTRNLLAGGFKGEIHLLNIKGGTIEGRPVLKSLAELQPARRSGDHHDAGRDGAAADPRARRARHQGRRRHHRRPGQRRHGARGQRPLAQAHPAGGAAASAQGRRAELHRLRRAAGRTECQLRAGRAQARTDRRGRAVGRRAGRSRRLGRGAGHRLLAPDLDGRHEPTSISATCSTCCRATTRRAPC